MLEKSSEIKKVTKMKIEGKMNPLLTTNQATRKVSKMINLIQETIVDQLRACRTPEQLLALDEKLNLNQGSLPLYRLICEYLRDRTIAPVEAANWLGTLMDNRERQLEDCLMTTCKLPQ